LIPRNGYEPVKNQVTTPTGVTITTKIKMRSNPIHAFSNPTMDLHPTDGLACGARNTR